MSSRPIFDAPDFPHGTKGYRRGCGCEVCKNAHRMEANEYNASRRRTSKDGAAIRPAGPVEKNVRRELKEASGFTPPWVQTLHSMALDLARAVDDAAENGPKTLLSPLSGRLLDVLDRIRSVAPMPRGSTNPDVGDEAEDFVNGIHKLGQ